MPHIFSINCDYTYTVEINCSFVIAFHTWSEKKPIERWLSIKKKNKKKKSFFSVNDIDEEVHCGIEHNQGVGDVLNDDQPERPYGHVETVLRVPGLEDGRDGLPNVTEEE